MDTIDTLSAAAERTWLDGWTVGPVKGRTTGNPPVDDPWRAVGEFVVGPDGRVRLPDVHPYCEAFPEPAVLVAAARLSRDVTETGLYATS